MLFSTPLLATYFKYSSVYMMDFFKIIFISLWLHWVLTVEGGLPLAVAGRGYSLLQCAGFSLHWLLFL